MTKIEIREIFQNQHDLIESSKESKLLIAHCGTFPTTLNREFSNALVRIATSHGTKKDDCKLLFSIMLESLKNLKIYAEPDEHNNKIGFLIVFKTADAYIMQLSNIVSQDNYKKVEKYLHQINTYTEEQLQETYYEILKNELLGLDGKKGRGFINARLKSKNKIEYSVNQLSNNLLLLNCVLVVNI